MGDPSERDRLSRLDDPDYPALTTTQAAELLGVQAAFLRSLDTNGVLQPHRSPGGHRRYSRHQLTLAVRLRELLDDGHTLSSAEVILSLQDELADARADSERLQSSLDRLHSDAEQLRTERDEARRAADRPPTGAPDVATGTLGGYGSSRRRTRRAP
jgi:excisionase family DNA binding protein